MPYLRPLSEAVDRISEHLASYVSSVGAGNERHVEWKDSVAEALDRLSGAVARVLWDCFAPQNHDGAVMVWPGVRLRLDKGELQRFFIPGNRLNLLGTEHGAHIRCRGCYRMENACNADAHVRFTGPIHAFNSLLAERPGTHDWLMTEPKCHGAQRPEKLRILRIATGAISLDAWEPKSRMLSVELTGDARRQDVLSYGQELGRILDKRFPAGVSDSSLGRQTPKEAGNRRWPFKIGEADQPRDANEIARARELYDLWLASVFSPAAFGSLAQRYGSAESGRQRLIEDSKIWTASYREWVSWRLSPTAPLRGDTRSRFTEELGSLMVLMTFPLTKPADPMISKATHRQDRDVLNHNGDNPATGKTSEQAGEILESVRFLVELAMARLRAADDSLFAMHLGEARLAGSIGHDLQKWAPALQRLLDPAEHYELPPTAQLCLENLAKLPPRYDYREVHTYLASLYSGALQFITLLKTDDMGLTTLRSLRGMLLSDWVAECKRIAVDLLTLRILSGRSIGATPNELLKNTAVLDRCVARLRRVRIDCVYDEDRHWRMPQQQEQNAMVALLTYGMVSLIMDFYKHGEWSSGMTLHFSRKSADLVVVTTNARFTLSVNTKPVSEPTVPQTPADACCSWDPDRRVWACESSIRAKSEDKIFSSLMTFAYLNNQAGGVLVRPNLTAEGLHHSSVQASGFFGSEK